MVDPKLYDMATPRQREILQAVERTGSGRAAAIELGVHHAYVSRVVAATKRKLARTDPSAHVDSAPAGYNLRGVSTLTDNKGNIKSQWVKTQQDKESQLEAMKAAIEEIADIGRGALEPIPCPPEADYDDTMAVYPMGDPHLGMLAWGRESGTAFDLDIATEQLYNVVDRLVGGVYSTKKALIINVGDFFHVDNKTNRTPQSGNVLDVDSRYGKLVRVGLALQRRIIDRCLQNHQEVEVWNQEGNHDATTALFLAVALAAIYENEPRVKISTEPGMFQHMVFGKNFIAATHGDTVKGDALPLLAATDWPDDWGRTRNRIWYTGHVHHDTVKEYVGCTVETLRSTAAKDAWHAAHGYRAGRDMKCDVWHKEFGRIGRVIQSVSAL